MTVLPSITCEFLGLAKHWCGLSRLQVHAGDLQSAMSELRRHSPVLFNHAGALRPGLRLCLNESQFLCGQEQLKFAEDATLLVLSADVGG